MGPVDRGVDRYLPVDQPGPIGLSEQDRQDLVPGPVPAEEAMALPHRLPRPETLGHIPPSDPGSVAVDDALQSPGGAPGRACPAARWRTAAAARSAPTAHQSTTQFSTRPQRFSATADH